MVAWRRTFAISYSIPPQSVGLTAVVRWGNMQKGRINVVRMYFMANRIGNRALYMCTCLCGRLDGGYIMIKYSRGYNIHI